ncbi:serine--tRNA ligase [Candidatus Pacearchaeota archaeon]|nr:serine--tRNA ligase [Candidatus Pacearchaeota archaeon]
MLDIKLIRENSEKVKSSLLNKRAEVDIDQLLRLDQKKLDLIKNLDNLKSQKNKLTGKSDEAIKIKTETQTLEAELKIIEKEFLELMYAIPNLPLASVPIGQDEKDNVVLRKIGPTKLDSIDQPKDYLELAQKLDLIDTERGAKTSGARFVYIKNKLVNLEIALIQFVLEVSSREGFIPILPPLMIKPEMMKAMGYMERGADEIYHIEKDDLYLIGTSEQAIGPMHTNETFEEKDLPRRYLGFSPCFRREAGSYGKDTKGILRVHQFDKIEMFSLTTPENSAQELEFILSMEEKLMQLLRLPYQVVSLCTGDLSNQSAITYDIEAWLPGQNQYRETHSCSNTVDFQSRRLNIKYKTNSTNKNIYVHMLNGTAFAIGRTLIAIIENYQQPDGSILVPEALQKYTNFKVID